MTQPLDLRFIGMEPNGAVVELDGTRLRGTAAGEPASRQRHAPAVEVKGATYTELRGAPAPEGGWIAQTVEVV